jgi:predicted GIY-YIG superfamily endonuclease
MYWVYILQNPSGQFYIGQTDDFPTRLANHNRTDKNRRQIRPQEWPMDTCLVGITSHPSRRHAMRAANQKDEVGQMDS